MKHCALSIVTETEQDSFFMNILTERNVCTEEVQCLRLGGEL